MSVRSKVTIFGNVFSMIILIGLILISCLFTGYYYEYKDGKYYDY